MSLFGMEKRCRNGFKKSLRFPLESGSAKDFSGSSDLDSASQDPCSFIKTRMKRRDRNLKKIEIHSLKNLKSNFGLKMKFTSNNTVLGAECGFHLKLRSQYDCIIRPEQSVGYLGAVNLSNGKMIFQREENKLNAEKTFLQFMKKLKTHARMSGKKIVLMIDHARYPHAKLHNPWRQENKQSIEWFFLPPYSPDLNPIERLWKLTRRLCVHNLYFPSPRWRKYWIRWTLSLGNGRGQMKQ